MKRIAYLITFVTLLGLILAGCTTLPSGTPTAVPESTPSAGTTPESMPSETATGESTSAPTEAPATTSPGGAQTLTVMTHDSFSVSEDVVAQFQSECGCTVQFLKSGDAGLALNRAILSKDNPLADVFFGVDNTFLTRALAADIFEPYQSPGLEGMPADLKLDPNNRVLPVDFGYVTINYDKKFFSDNGIALPGELRELADDAYKSMLVVENPASSSPGLAFLLATVATFGEDTSYTYLDYWQDLRDNDVLVTEGWEDAYYGQFSASSGEGDRPLVVSYATSPAAEVYFAEPQPAESPSGNLFLQGGSFKQVEFVGILRGAKQPDLARQWVDFMLGETFQADIPLQMWVYPAREGTPLPELFTKHAAVPAEAVAMTPEQIEAGREKWIKAWTDVMLR